MLRPDDDVTITTATITAAISPLPGVKAKNVDSSCFADLKDIERRMNKIQEGMEQVKRSAGIQLASELEALALEESNQTNQTEQIFTKRQIKVSAIKDTLRKHNTSSTSPAISRETLLHLQKLNTQPPQPPVDPFLASTMEFLREYLKLLRTEIILHFQNIGMNIGVQKNTGREGWAQVYQKQVGLVEETLGKAARLYAEIIIESKHLRLTNRQIDRVIDALFDVIDKIVHTKLNIRNEQLLDHHELRPVLDVLARKNPLDKSNYIHSATSPLINKLVPERTELYYKICLGANNQRFLTTALPVTLELVHQRLLKQCTDLKQCTEKSRYSAINAMKLLAERDFHQLSCLEFIP